MTEWSSEETQRALTELAEPWPASPGTRIGPQLHAFSDAQLIEHERAIEARVRAEVAEDIKIVLNQRTGHAHLRRGIWDDDNRPGVANTRCVECAARERLAAFAAAGSSRDTTPEAKP